MDTSLLQSLHLVAQNVEGQWVVQCLDFTLAAQDDTLTGAYRRLLAQIDSYVEDALTLEGGVHAEQLLRRQAPATEWLRAGFTPPA